jgi:hypothetical protein
VKGITSEYTILYCNRSPLYFVDIIRHTLGVKSILINVKFVDSYFVVDNYNNIPLSVDMQLLVDNYILHRI